jgi:hypothetical protein
MPPNSVGGIVFILQSGSEVATITVDTVSNALQMTISAGIAFAAAFIGFALF